MLAMPTPITATRMYHRIPMMTLTNAPIPAALAVFGFVSFHTRNKTRPTIGIQQPNNPQRKPPLSVTCGGVFGVTVF